MAKIRPVILCGGSGTRLWPLSRESYPKQFSKLSSPRQSLMQETISRMQKSGGERPLVLTAENYRFIIGEQLRQMGVEDGEIIIEPTPRNTAPAICAAALSLAASDPDTIMLISPSDHHIRDEKAFAQAMKTASELARSGDVVTLGIMPDRPETGYGYIELAEKLEKSGDAADFTRFTEKPDQKGAEDMLKSGNYLWNAGIFVASARVMLAKFEEHAPEILEKVRRAHNDGARDMDFFRLGPKFDEAENISIDYAIMEHITGKIVALDCGWNDLGSWQSVWLESERDKHGNASTGSVDMEGCTNSLFRVENDIQHIVAIGLDNVVGIAMRDAVLIANMSDTQRVSDAVKSMRKAGTPQADEFPHSARPWGTFETLSKRARFRVKSIIVKPDEKLSLQSHVHRAEHWVVVEGTARVTIGEEVKMVSENESVYIPLGAKHRLENPGKMELHLIEVQTGSYLEEDDIIRYEDIYARS